MNCFMILHAFQLSQLQLHIHNTRPIVLNVVGIQNYEYIYDSIEYIVIIILY